MCVCVSTRAGLLDLILRTGPISISANVEGPFAEKETLQGIVASVTLRTPQSTSALVILSRACPRIPLSSFDGRLSRFKV